MRLFGYFTIKLLGNRLSPTIFFTAFSLPLRQASFGEGRGGVISITFHRCENLFNILMETFSGVWKAIHFFVELLFTSVKSDSIFCWKPFHECEKRFSYLLETFSRVWKVIQYFDGNLFTSVKSDSVFCWKPFHRCENRFNILMECKNIHLCLIFAYWYNFMAVEGNSWTEWMCFNNCWKV